ncbi:MAG: type II toxin-antitoxin system VapC family toxin [Deltaproteobacteria bacterium]|nr:type II toxin-antitoxin system VapC family toxin [Deltaproteobacteria bacterium]
MSVVIDASITLSWYFEDERTPAANAVLDQVTAAGAVVPSLWKLETANGLQVAMRRQRVDAAFRERALVHLARLPITIDVDTDTYAWTTTLQLADRFQLTLYDAAYLELAQRRALPLATLDTELRAAAKALGLTLLGVEQ